MKQVTSILVFILLSLASLSQGNRYLDSLRSFRDKYVNDHEVIKDKEREQLQFYPIDKRYVVPARLERIDEAPWFPMETSGKLKKLYRAYGILHFTLNNVA
ncbi:MAG TPA: DUF1684 domain-containing protein, partial [Chitinophagaceae bacterium]|nr:DUF1684 domain-containing protein [Chitinophagaceae bacterium]